MFENTINMAMSAILLTSPTGTLMKLPTQKCQFLSVKIAISRTFWNAETTKSPYLSENLSFIFQVPEGREKIFLAENTPQKPCSNPYKTSIKIIIMAFSSQSLTVP